MWRIAQHARHCCCCCFCHWRRALRTHTYKCVFACARAHFIMISRVPPLPMPFRRRTLRVPMTKTTMMRYNYDMGACNITAIVDQGPARASSVLVHIIILLLFFNTYWLMTVLPFFFYALLYVFCNNIVGFLLFRRRCCVVVVVIRRPLIDGIGDVFDTRNASEKKPFRIVYWKQFLTSSDTHRVIFITRRHAHTVNSGAVCSDKE